MNAAIVSKESGTPGRFLAKTAPSGAYDTKTDNYFSKGRRSFVDVLPPNPVGRLLEIGCGAGNTSAYAMAQGKCGWCCGVELCAEPAAEAQRKLNHVIVGDVEQVPLDLPCAWFDVLLMSEVLEHLRNPGAVLEKLGRFMRSGAIVVAGSPNVCHFSTLWMLLRGAWDYQGEGIMDETHLRWFSPRTYREMFEAAGYVVDAVGPAQPLHGRAWALNKLLGGRFEYLFYPQIVLRGHRP